MQHDSSSCYLPKVQYFVTFTLLRSQAPQMFISGNQVNGRIRLEERLTFESRDTLRNQLRLAELPPELLEHDLLSPLLVTATQLQTLGVSTRE